MALIEIQHLDKIYNSTAVPVQAIKAMIYLQIRFLRALSA